MSVGYTIQDVCGDTLMSSKKREVVNRAKILEIIGKTEETVQDGISVKDVMPFFEKYCLQLRVYDEYMKLILKYDPVKPNHHNKALYFMVKEDHVYTLNNNLKELQQRSAADPEYSVFHLVKSDHIQTLINKLPDLQHKSAIENKMIVKASKNYYIKDDPVVPTFKMIDGVNDIIKLIREAKHDKTKDKTVIQ